MKPDFSVIIPYLPTPANDEALELALRCLHDNSNCRLEVIVDDGGRKHPDQYRIWQDRTAEARSENVLVLATDAVPGPDWDLALLKHLAPRAVFSGYTVECGVLGAAPDDIVKDFGRLPYAFDRPAFESYVREQMVGRPDVSPRKRSGTPCFFKRDWFLDIGGLQPDGAEHPLLKDTSFFDYCEKRSDVRFFRANSWFYHFQNLSYVDVPDTRGDISRYEVEVKEEGTKRIQLGVFRQSGESPYYSEGKKIDLQGRIKFGAIRMEWERP